MLHQSPTLSVAEVSALLHLSVKHVQRLARAGQLPAQRVGRRWLFRRADIAALLGQPMAPAVAAGTLDLSARNQLRATVVAVHVDGVMAEVRLRIGTQELVSVITRSSAERLGLVPGAPVLAVIKSTEIMIGRA
jgi:molybdopterin-binding protein